MDKSYNYFMKADLSRYIGEWVAIVDDEVVAHGQDVKKIYEESKRKYPKKKPLITKVPEKETMILVFIC